MAEYQVITGLGGVPSNRTHPGTIGILTDNSLIAVWDDNADNAITGRRSVDSGATWSNSFSINGCVGSVDRYAVLIQDDHVYWMDAVSNVLRFRSASWNGTTWTDSALCTSPLGTAAVGTSFLYGSLAKEPGGRLWAAARWLDGAGPTYEAQVAYSDDSGATWSSVTVLKTGSSVINNVVLAAFENNLVASYASATTVYTRDRLHTDAGGTWNAEVSRLTVDSGAAFMTGAPLATTPVKKWFIVANDSSSGSGGLEGIKIVETGSSLAYSTFAEVSITNSLTCVSGRTDGWIVISARAADTTHFRHHLITEAATAFPTESDVAITNTRSSNDFSTIRSMAVTLSNDGDLTWWSTAANTGYARIQNLAQILTATRILPVSWFSIPTFFRTLPIAWQGSLLSKRLVPISWISSFSFFVRQIPTAYSSQLKAERKLPIEWEFTPPSTFKRSLPITWTAVQLFKRQLPIGWTLYSLEEWIIISDPSGDTWAVLPTSPEADTWSALGSAEGDTWVSI